METEAFPVATCAQVPAFVPFTVLPEHWQGKRVKIVLCKDKPPSEPKETDCEVDDLDLPWD